jgi:hypothetical protein
MVTDNPQQACPANEQPQKKKTGLKSQIQKGLGQMIKNILKSLITTVLGILIILGSLYTSVVMENEWSDSIWGIAVGACLLFAPDTIVTKLKNFIK